MEYGLADEPFPGIAFSAHERYIVNGIVNEIRPAVYDTVSVPVKLRLDGRPVDTVEYTHLPFEFL